MTKLKEDTKNYNNMELDEIKENVMAFVQNQISELQEYDPVNNIQIVGIEIYGSRTRGVHKKNSDIDILIEYTGNMKEYVLFNILHENEWSINGMPVDINPIREEESGTLENYLESANLFLDKRIMMKNYNEMEKTMDEKKKDYQSEEQLEPEKIENQDFSKDGTTEESKTATEKLNETLEKGIKQTLDSERFADWCKKQSKLYFNNYSFNNAMLTYLQKPDASYMCGYETWKTYGRQVKRGAKGVKIFKPVFAYEKNGKGSLYSAIKYSCTGQLKKDPNLEYATFKLGKLSFNMYKNGLFDVKNNDKVTKAHITPDEMKKFLNDYVIGQVPVGYSAVTVFDISDTTDKVNYLWVNKNSCSKEEMVLDADGNPIEDENGKVKIVNSEERKARFNVDINMTLKEQDTDKMQILYETLQKISNDNGIPMSEAIPEKDDTLASGALGYYRHPSEENMKGNIVISSELSLTNKVAVAFHEMAHSDLHSDIDWLKDQMDLDAGEIITKQMKEVQAEAVAYMAASTFGIETEHKSFDYIANWSDGRELKTLANSMDVIYEESCRLLQEIEKELDVKGFTMSLELKDKTPLTDEQKRQKITEYKDFILNELRDNEAIQKAAFKDLKDIEDADQQSIIKEQILLTRKIEEKIISLNNKTEEYEKSYDKQEQVKLQCQMKAEKEQIKHLQDKLDQLSLKRIEVVKENIDNDKINMKKLYVTNPVKAIEKLKESFPQIKDLGNAELKYIANSRYISSEYSKYLGVNDAKFVELAMKQLDNFKEVLSKNKTVVEVAFCEQWGDEPIFEKGTLAHPKEANKIIANAENQIRNFKDQAEKKGEYYPYAKCELTVYSYTEKDNLSAINTRIDIGDREQKDLVEHMQQICSKGQEKNAILENFLKSTRERTNIQLLTPQEEQKMTIVDSDVLKNSNDISYSMEAWKESLSPDNSSMEHIEQNVEQQKEGEEKV